jgi:ubiquitin-protein ligase
VADRKSDGTGTVSYVLFFFALLDVKDYLQRKREVCDRLIHTLLRCYDEMHHCRSPRVELDSIFFPQEKELYLWLRRFEETEKGDFFSHPQRILLEVVEFEFNTKSTEHPHWELDLVHGVHELVVTICVPLYGEVKYRVEFANRHPFVPCRITCLTPIFHPGKAIKHCLFYSVKPLYAGYYADGRMCMDLLVDRWMPAMQLPQVVFHIESLLYYPDGVEESLQGAANEKAANMFKRDRAEFCEYVLKKRHVDDYL